MYQWRYYNLGFSAESVGADYVAQPGDVLFPAGPAPTDAELAAAFPSYAAVTLAAYAARAQANAAQLPVTVNVGTGEAPQNIVAETDPASLALLNGAYAMALANSSATFEWVETGASAGVSLTAAQIETIFAGVGAAMQASFTALSTALAGINASPPTITTTAAIDALFAG